MNECPAFGNTRLGQVTDNHNNQRYFSAKVVSNATWNMRPWANLKTTIGADYINQESDFSNTGGTQLPAGGETVAATASKTASNQQPTAIKTLGFYAQEQGAFRDRLFVTAAVRSDQNSAFGTQFQNVLYPKASISYLISDESWFPKLDVVNQVRLRGSYGASGVQPGSTSGLVTFATRRSVSAARRAHRHGHPRSARQQPRQRQPEAGNLGGIRRWVRRAPLRLASELRVHVLSEADPRRTDLRPDRAVVRGVELVGSDERRIDEKLGNRRPDHGVALRQPEVRVGRHPQRLTQHQPGGRSRRRSDHRKVARDRHRPDASGRRLSNQWPEVPSVHVR